MQDSQDTAPSYFSRRVLVAFAVVASLGYLAVAGLMVYLARHGINPDGVAYLRIARYYAEGRLDYALNSYWGPLLSWMLVPAFWLHLDPVYFCKAIGLVCGFLLAVVTARFSTRIEDRRGGWAIFAAILFFAADHTVYVTPDLLLSVLIVAYLAMAARFVMDRPSATYSLSTGILGGIAFLGKSYALPFVVAHLGMTFVLRFILLRRRAVEGPLLRPFVFAGIGFALLAVPWVGIMSFHEGRLTISGAGEIAHAWTLESERAQRGLPIYDLHVPREGRITGWENPPEMNAEWPTWSVFDGVSGVKKQVKTLVLNTLRILRYLYRSSFGVAYVGMALALLLLFPPWRALDSRRSVMRLWTVGSISIYCGGYALALFKPRYFWPIMGPLFAVALQSFDSLFFRETPDLAAPARRSTPQRSIYGLFAILLIGTMCMQATLDLKYAAEADGHRSYENKIERVNDQLNVPGPLVSNQWDVGLYLAYFRDLTYYGGYHGATGDEVAEELRPYGRVDVMVFDDRLLMQSLTDHPAFTLEQTLGCRNAGWCVWVFEYKPIPGRTP